MTRRIRLVFSTNRETFSIEIMNKVITYRDRRWPRGVQFMPYDKAVRRLIILSRNRIPQFMLTWIEDANSGKNLEEYNSAKDDEALVPIIKKDAGTRGCIFHKRFDEEVDENGQSRLIEEEKKEKEEVEKLAKEAEIEAQDKAKLSTGSSTIV